MTLPAAVYTPAVVADLEEINMQAKQTEVATVEPRAIAPASESGAIISMIERASRDPAVDIEKFERLMAMSERIEKDKRLRAFNAAVAAAKGEFPLVLRNSTGHNNAAYADFSAVTRAVDGPLSAHGLSYRFRTNQTPTTISVTCVLSHSDGHSEENTLVGPPDTTGNKNVVQSIGSTLTYFQRYSLMQAVGVAAARDDDGNGGRPKPNGVANQRLEPPAPVDDTLISDEQVATLREALAFTGSDERRFCAHIKVECLADIVASKFQKALDIISQKGGAK